MIPLPGWSRSNVTPAASSSSTEFRTVDRPEHPGLVHEVADAKPPERVDALHLQLFGNLAVLVGEEVVPLVGRALVVPDEEDDVPVFRLVTEQFVPGQPGKAVFIDDHLRGEIDRVDLPDLLGAEHLDHVLGDEFPYLADTGKPFDEDGIDRCFVLETVGDTGR